MLPNIDCKDIEEDDKIFGESYDSEESENGTITEHASEIGIKEYGSEEGGSRMQQMQPFNAELDAPPAFDADLDKPPPKVGILGQTKLGDMGQATQA